MYFSGGRAFPQFGFRLGVEVPGRGSEPVAPWIFGRRESYLTAVGYILRNVVGESRRVVRCLTIYPPWLPPEFVPLPEYLLWWRIAFVYHMPERGFKGIPHNLPQGVLGE